MFAPEVEHSVEVTAISYRIKISKLLYCTALLSVTLLKMDIRVFRHSCYICSRSWGLYDSIEVTAVSYCFNIYMYIYIYIYIYIYTFCIINIYLYICIYIHIAVSYRFNIYTFCIINIYIYIYVYIYIYIFR